MLIPCIAYRGNNQYRPLCEHFARVDFNASLLADDSQRTSIRRFSNSCSKSGAQRLKLHRKDYLLAGICRHLPLVASPAGGPIRRDSFQLISSTGRTNNRQHIRLHEQNAIGQHIAPAFHLHIAAPERLNPHREHGRRIRLYSPAVPLTIISSPFVPIICISSRSLGRSR